MTVKTVVPPVNNHIFFDSEDEDEDCSMTLSESEEEDIFIPINAEVNVKDVENYPHRYFNVLYVVDPEYKNFFDYDIDDIIAEHVMDSGIFESIKPNQIVVPELTGFDDDPENWLTRNGQYIPHRFDHVCLITCDSRYQNADFCIDYGKWTTFIDDNRFFSDPERNSEYRLW